MKQLLKNTFFFTFMVMMISSCAKEEFAINKGAQTGSVNPIETTTNKLCSQSTLISPQVDILMLWDNSSSFNFVTPATKASMSKLISSVSENFDYHILSLPLVPTNTQNPLHEGILVAKNSGTVSGTATSILRTKEQAVASLAFSQGVGSNERGIDRAISVVQNNQSNGIFRKNAYTIIVVMSNEDDKGCEADRGLNSCTAYDRNLYTAPKKTKLLCLRGKTSIDCSQSGVTSLNATMMRFINISPLTSCSLGFNNQNTIYRDVAKTIYQEPYNDGWPTSNDHISPDVSGAPDSYNLCSMNFNHIFDGVNTAIKQTLLKHRYEYWPVAGDSASIDPDSIRVVRSDGKILTNRRVNNVGNGYELLLDGSGRAETATRNTRYYPTAGEPFTGKMIRLFGTEGNDKVVYPDCLTVTYDAEKIKYGYIYLKYGEPNVDSIEVRINGNLVPKNATNGWSYMGLQYTSALNQSFKVFDLPAGASSGYMLQLNGSYQFTNTGSAINITVYYNSRNQ